MPIDRDKVNKQAELYLASGKVAKAIEEFLKLLEDNPKDLNLANRLGDIYLQENKREYALGMFKRAAGGFERDGFLNKAIAIYKKAHRAFPDDIDLPASLVELYKQSNMTKEAIQLHLQLADNYIKKGLTPRALREFTKIVELEPKNIKNKMKLAELCHKEGQKNQAVEIYLETVDMLVADNLHAEAGQILERVKSLSTSPRVFLTLSNISVAQHDYSAAKKHLDDGLAANPKNTELLVAKADVDIKQNQPLAALQLLAEMPQLSQDSLPICELALRKCHAIGSVPKAVEVIHDSLLEMAKRGLGDFVKLTLHNALENEPIPEYWMFMAEIAHQNGARDERVDSLKYALSLLAQGDPRIGGIRLELQSLGVSQDDMAGQGPPVIQHHKDNQAQTHGLDQRQSMQARQLVKEAQQFESGGNPEKAVDAYQRALIIDPTNVEAIYRIVDIYKATGMLTKAQAHLTKMAQTLANDNIPELALKCLDSAEELIPGSTRVTRLMLGDALIVAQATPATVPTPAAVTVQLPTLDDINVPSLPPLDIIAPLPISEPDDAQAALPITSLDVLPEPEPIPAPVPIPVATPVTHASPSTPIPVIQSLAPTLASQETASDTISEALRQLLCSIDFQLDYGSPSDAKVDIERALVVHKGHPELLSRLTQADEKLKQYEAKSEKGFPQEESVFDLSNLLDMSFGESLTAGEVHDNTRAAEAIQSAEDIFNAFKDEVAQQLGSEDYETYYNLGIGYKEMMLLEPAIEEFKKAMRDPERTLECCSMIAVCEESAGNVEAAMKWLKKGINDPGFPPLDSVGLRYELGVILQKTGRQDEARVHFDEVQRLCPGYESH